MSNSFLRSLVKEMLLSETPLMDIYPYKGSVDSMKTKPGIGYQIPKKIKGKEEERRKVFSDEAKVLLADSKDNWYIIVLKNSASSDMGYFFQKNYPSNLLKSEEFKEWFKSLKIPKKSKIIVALSTPYKGDFTSSSYAIVHDIIGHSITQKLETAFDSYKKYEHRKKREIMVNSRLLNVVKAVWEILPEEFKISKADVNDREPDIYAAIFANKFDKQKAKKAIEAAFEKSRELGVSVEVTAEEVIEFMHHIVNYFKKLVPFDKPVAIHQWE
jgi:hypothetical protein